MRQPTQDYSARRFSPEFDCQLPPDVRTELLRPRRVRILIPPPPPPQKPSWVDCVRSWRHPALGGICGLFFIVALGAVVSWFANKPANHLVPVPAVAQP